MYVCACRTPRPLTCSTGRLTRSSRSLQSCSNWARDRVVSMCLGPSAVAVMKGRLMEVWGSADSSILAFSAASVRRCRACLHAGSAGKKGADGTHWVSTNAYNNHFPLFNTPGAPGTTTQARQRLGHTVLCPPFSLLHNKNTHELTHELTHTHAPVLAQVDALVLLEVICQEVHDALVKVVTAQVGVARGGQHLKHTVTNLRAEGCAAAGCSVDRPPPSGAAGTLF